MLSPLHRKLAMAIRTASASSAWECGHSSDLAIDGDGLGYCRCSACAMLTSVIRGVANHIEDGEGFDDDLDGRSDFEYLSRWTSPLDDD
jgi:hypothetical protein